MFIAIGGAFAVGSLSYDLGSLLQMGPAYVPLLVGLVLAALGAGIIVKAFVAPDRTPSATDGTTDQGAPLQFGRIHWRPTLFIFASLFFFAFTFEGLGLFITVFGTSVLASYARAGTTVRQAVLPAVGLSVGSWLVFVLALQQRLPLLGEWLGG